jgi:hypothetical protein
MEEKMTVALYTVLRELSVIVQMLIRTFMTLMGGLKKTLENIQFSASSDRQLHSSGKYPGRLRLHSPIITGNFLNPRKSK